MFAYIFMYLDISCNMYYSSGIVTSHHHCLMLLLLFSTIPTISQFIWAPATTTCTFISSFSLLPSHQFRNQSPFSPTVSELLQKTYKNCNKTLFSNMEVCSACGFSWSLCAAGIEPSSCNGPSALPTPLPASLAYFWELWVNSSYKLLKCQRS